jgi:glycosyltransferase involved in cell wall biosynthesis
MSADMRTASLAVVIPTYNSERTLEGCLDSLVRQTVPPSQVVIVDDIRTTDNTREIAQRFGVGLIVSPAGRAKSRNQGVAATDSDFLLSLDSDMRLLPSLVSESLDELAKGAEALTIPEVAVGPGYWTRARRIDKASVELTRFGVSLRVFSRVVFNKAGGFDETLLAGEDLDFHHRVVETGAVVRHIGSSHIEHDEGALTLRSAIRKKYWYGMTLPAFESKHGTKALTDGFPQRLWTGIQLGLRRDPLAVPGFVILKGGEAIGGFSGRYAAKRGRLPKSIL